MRLLLLPLLVLLAWLRRRSVARRFERDVAARLPVGADGIVRGAGPIAREGSGGRAALLLHGFGDTPQTMAALAAHLAGGGWTVRVPLLPAHGRTARAFARADAGAWIDAARREYAAMRERHGEVALVGLSMGGALAVILAAEAAEPPALALVAPYLAMPRSARWAARLWWLWGPLVPYFAGGDAARSIHDPAERARSLAYGVVTPRALRALRCVVRRARAALPRVSAPTLVVHSRDDYRIATADAQAAWALLGAPERRLVWSDAGGHILTVDVGRERLFALVQEWLEAHPGGGASRATPASPAVQGSAPPTP